MPLGRFPFMIYASAPLQKRLGKQLPHAAEAALRAVLERRQGLEIACLQIDWRGEPIVFSSRVNRKGDIVVEMEEGDPRLGERVVLEGELRGAEREARERDRFERGPRSR